MGLFSRGKPKSWLGRYVAHVGAWGILAIPFALIFATMFIGNVKNQLTLRPVEATVISVRSECRLKWTEDGKSKKGRIRPCAEAERYRDKSTKRLYRIDRDDFATVEWRESTGQSYQAELDHIDTGKIGDPEPGETVTVIAKGGIEPQAAASHDAQDFTINAAFFAFCAWLAWPPRRPGNERAPLIHIHRKKGFTGWITESIGRWSFYGAVLGAITACIGAWLFMTIDRSGDRYASTEARIIGIEESCRLSPDNGKILKIETLQKISCDRARAIQRNRPEENYSVLERPDYTIRYTDYAGIMHDKELSTSAIRDLDPAIGDVIALDIRKDDPTRIRIARDPDEAEDRTPLDHTMMKYGGLLTFIGGQLAWLFGVRIDLSRLTRIKRRTQRMVHRRT